MKVALFTTCLVNVFYPNVGKSTLQLLQTLGCEVDIPLEQTCCGQPAYNSGFLSKTKTAANHLIKTFADADYIVTPSGSCAAMIAIYPEIFENEPVLYEKAILLKEKTYELTDFIVNVLHVTDVGASLPLKATYHPSCHMTRLLRVKNPPYQLLANIADLQLLDLPNKEDCCGFGGVFSVKMSKISQEMVSEKINHIEKTDAELLISSDCGCLMNMEGRLSKFSSPIKVMHIAEVLTSKSGVGNSDN